MEQEAWQVLIVEDDQRLAELTRDYLKPMACVYRSKAMVRSLRIASSRNNRTW